MNAADAFNAYMNIDAKIFPNGEPVTKFTCFADTKDGDNFVACVSRNNAFVMWSAAEVEAFMSETLPGIIAGEIR